MVMATHMDVKGIIHLMFLGGKVLKYPNLLERREK